MSEDSSPAPFGPSKNRGVSEFDFVRLERKVDRMADALNTLIRVEERQTNESKRINDLETDAAVTRKATEMIERKLDQWINRGIGAWFLALMVWGSLKLFLKV